MESRFDDLNEDKLVVVVVMVVVVVVVVRKGERENSPCE